MKGMMKGVVLRGWNSVQEKDEKGKEKKKQTKRKIKPLCHSKRFKKNKKNKKIGRGHLICKWS